MNEILYVSCKYLITRLLSGTEHAYSKHDISGVIDAHICFIFFKLLFFLHSVFRIFNVNLIFIGYIKFKLNISA